MPIHKLRSRDCGLIATHFASAARADSFVRGTENPASSGEANKPDHRRKILRFGPVVY
jgi:hypothetical protein